MLSIKILDYLAFILFLAAVAGSILWSSAGRADSLVVEIEASGELYLMPLEQDGELVVHGPVGDTTIRVHEREAAVTRSDCRDELCVAMGSVSSSSGWIACLPNRVFLRLVPASGQAAEGEVDAAAF